MSKHNQPPQYHPISMLPTFTYMIDGELAAAEEQLPNLEAAKSKPWVLDDFTVNRVIAAYNEQRGHLPLFDEQLRRWQAITLTDSQRREVERLQGQMVRLHEITAIILRLADELKQGTIEKQMSKSDLELGMETLFNKWRTSK